MSLETYTRVLMDASPEFPIHFLKIYSISMGSGIPVLTVNMLSIKLDGIAPFISPALSESHNGACARLETRGQVQHACCLTPYHLLPSWSWRCVGPLGGPLCRCPEGGASRPCKNARAWESRAWGDPCDRAVPRGHPACTRGAYIGR